MCPDALSVLLKTRRWVRHRVDRVEFLDLMTVRRTIALTLDLGALADVLPRCGSRVIPLGWFVPWANAGAELVDADGHVIPYLTSQESDFRVQPQIEDRLTAVGITDENLADHVKAIRLHRKDVGPPGYECASCTASEGTPGEAELMADKWGCRATRPLLEKLCCLDSEKARELARILLAWQTNFVLFARVDASRPPASWTTLKLSFDEELREWEPPWEHHKQILEQAALAHPRSCGDRKWPLKLIPLPCDKSRECRKHISRGGPHQGDLDKLLPRGLDGIFARSRNLWLRKAGRRGMLGLAWHVAWLQASGMDVASHQVDVILPSELMAVRMRMLRARKEKLYANVADQVGARATIVAPEVNGENGQDQRLPPPTLLSLVITHRSPASWYGGAWIAFLTGIAILATALWWLPQTSGRSTDAITILIVAPTLVATWLSVRAGSDIAEQLTKTLRRLIGAVGVLAAACAVSLVALHPRRHGMPTPTELKYLWIAAGVLLLSIAGVLLAGAYRLRRLITYGQAPRPRKIEARPSETVLSPEGAPRIPPPDRWLAADEGELLPWGWLNVAPSRTGGSPASPADGCFWKGTHNDDLIEWIQDSVAGFGDEKDSPGCSPEQCRAPTSARCMETVDELNGLLDACRAVVQDMQVSVDRDGADVDSQRLTANLETVASKCDALEPSNLHAAVKLLWRLASEELREREASQARVGAIERECKNVERLARDYQSRLRHS